MDNTGIRLNKYLSDAGVCSRRQADRWVEEGKITINGNMAVMGQRVLPGDKVAVNGKPIKKEEDKVLLAYNKPRGIVCTTSKVEKNNIVDYINYDKRIYPVGRLDKDSSGLILLTNQGELVDKILRGSNYHEKEYIVTVNKKITPEFLRAMGSGVPILDTVTRPCELEQIGPRTFRIILTQGLNRQIRRMCEYFDYKVVELKRVRIMNIRLGKLKEGTYRKIAGKELEELKRLL
ncbi:MAG: 23S rRNA pseudouridine(2604) synthase RluF [Lachnospiraceae bacterium]|nr:23S rRNA pseudouridine(2604) synthase RluF [Lachnospiraceae bacterium]